MLTFWLSVLSRPLYCCFFSVYLSKPKVVVNLDAINAGGKFPILSYHARFSTMFCRSSVKCANHVRVCLFHSGVESLTECEHAGTGLDCDIPAKAVPEW